jgi:hypothetical protein
MRNTEQLFRGHILCSTCGKNSPHTITQDSEFRLAAICWYCSEMLKKTGADPGVIAVAQPCGIHAEWSLVERAKIHTLDTNSHDRRGTIVSITMKDITNVEMARDESVIICQFLMFFGGQYGISRLGQEGEQNHAWITHDYAKPITTRIIHKYLGDTEIECIRDTTRLLARHWSWELEDDTISPLERLAKAL